VKAPKAIATMKIGIALADGSVEELETRVLNGICTKS
jgi:hypothetical protein